MFNLFKRKSNSGLNTKVKHIVTISARVIRKDGTIEDLGTIYKKGGRVDGKS